jgi:hypothetical protein
MSAARLLLAEIGFRKINFALSLLAMTVAAMLFVVGPVLIDGYRSETGRQLAAMEARTRELVGGMDRELVQLASQTQHRVKAVERELAQMEDETRKLMLRMGFNLLIVHQDVNMSDFWADDFAQQDMPQEYVERLAASPKLEHVRHLVATLQQKIKWRNRTVLLVGYLRETPQKHFADKKPMGYDIQPGTAFVGYELWAAHDLKEGDSIEVLGQPFTIAKALKEQGSKEDITLALNLADAQQLLQKPGRVNQILALGCQCEGDRLGTIRAELAATLPETKITEFQSIAQARAEQRDLVAAKRDALLKEQAQHKALVESKRAALLSDLAHQRDLVASHRLHVQTTLENLAAIVTPLVIAAAGVWVGLLALANVRERRPEIGLLRALGKSSWQIGGLFLGRAVLVGLLGGGLGFFLGAILARQAGSLIFDLAPDPFRAASQTLCWTLLGAPLVAALACYLPMLRAVLQDPAEVLREA